MAANSSFTDIIATTLQGYSGEMADNITNHNALFRQIERKGNQNVATGRSIVQELEYEQNSNIIWYSGAETLPIAQQETFSAAEYSYKQLAGNVTITGLEEIQNSGKEAVHNLLRARIRNLDKSLRNTMAAALYADGTGNGGKEIGGLQLLVAGTPTNTVGGIAGTVTNNSGVNWWQNYVYDFSTASVTASATTIQRAMNLAWLNTIRGGDKADIICADQTYYLYYWESLQSQQRFTDDKNAGAGFTNIVYHGNVPVVFDDQCPTTKMYFLNTDYLFMRPAKGRNFKPLADKASVNQDAMVMPVVWAGNMTTNNRSMHAVIQA
jgi:hypothetical protein